MRALKNQDYPHQASVLATHFLSKFRVKLQREPKSVLSSVPTQACKPAFLTNGSRFQLSIANTGRNGSRFLLSVANTRRNGSRFRLSVTNTRRNGSQFLCYLYFHCSSYVSRFLLSVTDACRNGS